MKNILIIMKDYFPYKNAITNIINDVIDELSKNNKIDVLTCKGNVSDASNEVVDGINVYRTNDWIKTFNCKSKSFDNQKIIIKIYIFIYKIWVNLKYFFIDEILNYQDSTWNTKETVRLGKKLFKKYKYDIIISISYPFKAHIIAKKIKNKNKKIRWYAIQLDPYTFNKTLRESGIKKRKKLELNTFWSVEKILLPEENLIQNLECSFEKLKNKYEIFHYPNIKKPKYEIKPVNNRIPIFVFAGMLYKDIRNPEKVLEFLSKIHINKMKFKLLLYYIGDEEVDIILYKYKSMMGERLVFYKDYPKEICDKAIFNADILINIGNSVSNQTPSKIFENISTGKPIINFYTIENDTCKDKIKKYKLGLNINLNEDLNKNIELLTKYVDNTKGKLLSFKEATEKLMTAQEAIKNTINIIMEKK